MEREIKQTFSPSHDDNYNLNYIFFVESHNLTRDRKESIFRVKHHLVTLHLLPPFRREESLANVSKTRRVMRKTQKEKQTTHLMVHRHLLELFVTFLESRLS